MTLEEINAKLPEYGQLTPDNLNPGTYFFFTDDDGTDTHCLNIDQIRDIDWDDDIKEISFINDDNVVDTLFAMGSIYVITIK